MANRYMKNLEIKGLVAMLGIVLPLPVFAHAMPEQSVPAAGAVLAVAPTRAQVRFDTALEPLFSSLIVKNRQGVAVSQGKGRVDPAHRAVLSTQLPHLVPGPYHVFWTAVGHDGHRTQGDYTFTVR
jgi:copper resistance protein C